MLYTKINFVLLPVQYLFHQLNFLFLLILLGRYYIGIKKDYEAAKYLNEGIKIFRNLGILKTKLGGTMEILSTGEKIKRARIYKGITLKELCGEEISISKMSCIENGKIKADDECLDFFTLFILSFICS